MLTNRTPTPSQGVGSNPHSFQFSLNFTPGLPPPTRDCLVTACSFLIPSLLLFKVWPSIKQHPCHLGTCLKCRISDPFLDRSCSQQDPTSDSMDTNNRETLSLAQRFSNMEGSLKHRLLGPTCKAFDSVGGGWGLMICMLSKFPGNTDTDFVAWGTTL